MNRLFFGLLIVSSLVGSSCWLATASSAYVNYEAELRRLNGESDSGSPRQNLPSWHPSRFGRSNARSNKFSKESATSPSSLQEKDDENDGKEDEDMKELMKKMRDELSKVQDDVTRGQKKLEELEERLLKVEAHNVVPELSRVELSRVALSGVSSTHKTAVTQPVPGWLPVGANLARRRAQQEDALMAHMLETSQIMTKVSGRNVTAGEHCPRLLDHYASYPNIDLVTVKDFMGISTTSGTQADRLYHIWEYFMSQFRQDWILFASNFANSKDPYENRKKVYVDLAAAWPSRISNTFFFDACLGWEGICIEADPSKKMDLLKHRGCVLVDTCITDVAGKVKHIIPRQTSGRNKVHQQSVRGSRAVECTTLEKVFTSTGVTHVDLLSLDVEGHELEALRSIDFSRVRIETIWMEVKDYVSDDSTWKVGAEEIVSILRANGYVPTLSAPGLCKFGLKSLDDVFLRVDASNGGIYQNHDMLFVLQDSAYLENIVRFSLELARRDPRKVFVKCIELLKLVNISSNVSIRRRTPSRTTP